MPREFRFGSDDVWIQMGVHPEGNALVVTTLEADCVRCLIALRSGDFVKPAMARGARAARRRTDRNFEWRHATCDPDALRLAQQRKAVANDEVQRLASARKKALQYTTGGALTVSRADHPVARVAPYNRIDIHPAVRASVLDDRRRRRSGA